MPSVARDSSLSRLKAVGPLLAIASLDSRSNEELTMATTRRVSIERVLCPIDFSDISHHALAHAAAMARWHGAQLTLLHVFPYLPAMDLPPFPLEDVDRANILAKMREFAAIVPRDVDIDCQLAEGQPVHEAISRHAATTRADMLVMGTHGRSGFRRAFLGSVTEKVIRQATCPTLVVPPRVGDVAPDTPVQFRRILCPTDFLASSLKAFEYALSLAEEADAELTLLHVVEMLAAVGQEPPVADDQFARLRGATIVEARRRLNELIPDDVRAYCTVDALVVEGRAYKEILCQAKEKRADLIVMGVHGRGAIDLLLFGSTTHHVLRASTCPVLIVRQG
jgi:nucleotide-binding universal stress UspA family protein